MSIPPNYCIQTAIYSIFAISFLQASLSAEESLPFDSPHFLLQWGSTGAEPGQFNSPICIAITAKDEVFVADLNNSRVQQFTTDGTFVSEFALPLDDPMRKSCIVGGMTAGADGGLYISFMNQHRIGLYSQKGELIRQWGKRGSADGEFHQPGGIVIRSDGKVVVADQCNHRIQEFSPQGNFIRQWGEYGEMLGQFGGPESSGSRFGGPHFLTLDTLGRFYTTEGASGRIQQLNADGQPLAAWGSKTAEPGAFGEYHFGNLKNTFGPIGVFADNRNRIWISSLNDRVQCFNSDGSFLFRLDGIGENDTFTHPHGMAQDSQGNLYVADSGNQRIVKFQTHWSKFECRGTSSTQMNATGHIRTWTLMALELHLCRALSSIKVLLVVV